MLTGNASIHLIRIKREMRVYSRMADRKIEVLREVIRRVQNGEVFDVEKALGTGTVKKEREWDEGRLRYARSGDGDRLANWNAMAVIREIERDESIVGRAERQRLRREGRKQDELEGNTEVEEARGKKKEAERIGQEETSSENNTVQATRRPSFL
jgi:hypothetical protein